MFGNCNWGGGDVDIDVNRATNIDRSFNRCNVEGGGKWKHDASHRQGVAYRDNATRQKLSKDVPAPRGATITVAVMARGGRGIAAVPAIAMASVIAVGPVTEVARVIVAAPAIAAVPATAPARATAATQWRRWRRPGRRPRQCVQGVAAGGARSAISIAGSPARGGARSPAAVVVAAVGGGRGGGGLTRGSDIGYALTDLRLFVAALALRLLLAWAVPARAAEGLRLA